jgi:hypothetical protein
VTTRNGARLILYLQWCPTTSASHTTSVGPVHVMLDLSPMLHSELKRRNIPMFRRAHVHTKQHYLQVHMPQYRSVFYYCFSAKLTYIHVMRRTCSKILFAHTVLTNMLCTSVLARLSVACMPFVRISCALLLWSLALYLHIFILLSSFTVLCGWGRGM